MDLIFKKYIFYYQFIYLGKEISQICFQDPNFIKNFSFTLKVVKLYSYLKDFGFHLETRFSPIIKKNLQI